MSKKNKNTVNVDETVVEEGVEAPVEKKDSLLKRGWNKVKGFTSNPKVKKTGKIVGTVLALGAAFCAGNAYGNGGLNFGSSDSIDDAEPEILDTNESSDLD